MGVVDEFKFILKSEQARVSRLCRVAVEAETDPSDKNKTRLRVMAERVEEGHASFMGAITKLVSYNAKNNIEDDYESDIVQYEESYYQVKAILEQLFPSQGLAAERSESVAGSATAQAGMTLSVQMPKLKLPEFEGEIKAWPQFAEMFTSMIHQNPALSNQQRHMYLRGQLRGEAQALVSNLPVTAANYSVCWDTLRQRYDNVHLQTAAHLETICSLPKTSNNAAPLRLFASKLTEATGALRALEYDVESWAVPILFMCTKRLHSKLREDWEKHVNNFPSPRISDFTAFLHDYARILEVAHSQEESHAMVTKQPHRRSGAFSQNSPKRTVTLMTQAGEKECQFCHAQHDIAGCRKFRLQPAVERLNFARDNRLCLACFSSDHFSPACHRSQPCKYCSFKHHSLLHTGPKNAADTNFAASSAPRKAPGSPDSVQALQVATSRTPGQVVLATAIAHIKDSQGTFRQIRLLIDPGSQATFISKSCVKRLTLQAHEAKVPVLGMGHTSLGVCRRSVRCEFQPASSVELVLDALVTDYITTTPTTRLTPVSADRITGKRLADPGYYIPGNIDVLLGAEWFGVVTLGKPILGPSGTPCLLESIWGYCIIGRHGQAAGAIRTFCTIQGEGLDGSLRRFWEIEEPPSEFVSNPKDQACERKFEEAVTRNASGRYIVALPFDSSPDLLGNSRTAALRRFQLLERRLGSNPTLQSHYVSFMDDMLAQGHMIEATKPPRATNECYYIPHHPIFRESAKGEIEKFRVVFDSSMPTVRGPSLNQVSHKGPKLQADIVDILCRFRLHAIVVVADIRQMYRNILLHKQHWDYQRIFWRSRPEDPLREYWLVTVTYGLASSPYLALRTLQQLVNDEGDDFPMAAEALSMSTYMDDIIRSVPTLSEALRLKVELQQLLGRGCFELRKWVSNSQELLRTLPADICAMPADSLSFESLEEPSTKILGLVWHPTSDKFSFKIRMKSSETTKRSIMSDIARLYDPLGLVGPVVFVGKCLLRYLWQAGIGWDESVPSDVKKRWAQFQMELPTLERVSVPRCLSISDLTDQQLHGFADSSEQGYAGVVYLRTTSASGQVSVHLLMAKSKVAPLKVQTLPRLELCAIELTTRLLRRSYELLQPHGCISSTTVWTDSMVALQWVTSSPHRWKTFIANRVSAAQSRVEPGNYRHVPTDSNPADCASRGMFPAELLNHSLWWAGPKWLYKSTTHWPSQQQPPSDEAPEARVMALLATRSELEPQPLSMMIQRCSSFTKLSRITAWMLRFLNNRIVARVKGGSSQTGVLTLAELRRARQACIRLTQADAFSADLKRLAKGTPLSHTLRRLNPFLDEHGLLRVGGRLRNAPLSYDQKHPVILPKTHHFTQLVINHYHKLHLHAGMTSMRNILSREFWIISAASAIHACVSKCVSCFRRDPRPLQPFMADLPIERVEPAKPFSVVGVDYGGPFEITMSRIRGSKVLKAYICLFVCFSTKATHLELASDLSTECFLAAFRRFIARRGSVSTIFSDCGTNFIGAKRKMEAWDALVRSSEFHCSMNDQLAVKNIDWRPSPAGSPHFNGLMEAGIKSAKKLLGRVLGDQLLTYEEFYTVLTQVEATLNSRPLEPLSADPDDIQALTPGHFLLMEPPSALREPQLDGAAIRARDRWSLLQQVVSAFWKRWSLTYLNSLQQRHKWNIPQQNLEEGTLVVVKEENLAPLQWRLGRVSRTFPGDDGIVRVAEVKTSSGIIRRATVKLCPLPIN